MNSDEEPDDFELDPGDHPAEILWQQVIEIIKEVQAIRQIEAAEKPLLFGPFARHAKKARRMLDLCACKKLALQQDLALLVDRVLDDPYWDGVIAKLDRKQLAEQVHKYGGKP